MTFRHDTYKKLKANFLEHFPTFSRFDARCAEYAEVERNYKDELIALYNERVRELLRAFPASSAEQAAIATQAIQLFREKLQTESGRPQNLVGWRYSDLLFKLTDSEKPIFAQALAILIDEQRDIAERIDAFVDTLKTIYENHGDKLGHAASRSVTTFYLFLDQPQEHFFIKTTEVNTFLRAFTGEKIRPGLLDAEGYTQVITAAQQLRGLLTEDGLNPQDMVDVQSFMWMGLYPAEGTEGTAGNDTKETEEDVENTQGLHTMLPLNTILYGPPGTGKTYNTLNKALQILDPDFYAENANNRTLLKQRFDDLKERGRIGFVTFHQSFSYEDFVEGLKASADDAGRVSYQVEDGIFKRMCESASAKITYQQPAPIDLTGRRVWKMSLGNTLGEDAYIYDDCIQDNVIRLGYGHGLNFEGCNKQTEIKQVHQAAGVAVTDTDYSVKVTNYFINSMNIGDLVVISAGNHKFRAIGEITGNYVFDADREDWYKQTRAVRWLRTYSPSLPVDQLMDKVFSQQTLYRLGDVSLKPARLIELLGASPTGIKSPPFKAGDQFNNYRIKSASSELLRVQKPNESVVCFDMEMLNELAGLVESNRISVEDIKQKNVFAKVPESTLERNTVNGYCNIIPRFIERIITTTHAEVAAPKKTVNDARVLIIDEINRGNIANIFGELITLIEESKRDGQPESLAVTLPYSKESFTVPNNLYLIGTMNTADRSLIHMDTALRRRFEFEAMMPREALLEGLLIAGEIDVAKMLRAINDRISVLYDREHTLGHSFFLPLMALKPARIEDLANIFSRQVLPLLEEYFFEDWSKIRQVLGDDRKPLEAQLITPAFTQKKLEELFGKEAQLNGAEGLYQRNQDALLNPNAYKGIYSSVAQ
jgi:5-methylcytosine-specific restriction protein B